MFADAQRISAVTIADGGSGYKVGDRLAILGGNILFPHTQACYQVTGVDDDGAITAVAPIELGGYTVNPATPNSVYGGSGSGAQLGLTFTLYWANSPWVVLESWQITQVIAQKLFNDFNANVGANQPALPQPIDLTKDDRAGKLLDLVVARIRGAIVRGGRVPLSLTAKAIPPEACEHALNVAAWQLCNSTPSFSMAIVTEKGAYAPFAQLAKAGEEFITALGKGANTEYPSDPDPSFRGAVRYGANQDDADMTLPTTSYSQPAFLPNLGTL